MGERFSGESPWRRSRIVVRGAAPAAGADWSFVVPAGHVYRVISLYASLVTAVAVANRVVQLVASDGVASFLTIAPAAVQAASLTYGYAWWEHAPGALVGTGQAIPLVPLVLEAGWSLASSTTAIQAADQWGAPALHVIDTTVRDGAVDVGLLPDMMVEITSAQG
jgi:hypothetical protein